MLLSKSTDQNFFFILTPTQCPHMDDVSINMRTLSVNRNGGHTIYIRHADVCLCQTDMLVCDNRLLLQQQNSNSTCFSSVIKR
ncbi:hypothetical protein LDENG_00075780 [Lucifuga dentata]|nr:hypothetical protein LDENG_00075780 [Lucifuga dentata]